MHRSALPSAAVAALTVACAAATALPAATLGAQITNGSTLVFTGVADATDVGTPGVTLDFTKRVEADPKANTGTFAGLNKKNGANGSIQSILVGNGPKSVETFLRIGAYTFDLRAMPSGMYGQEECYIEPVIGQKCTPFQSAIGDPTDNLGLSPFFVQNWASDDPNAPFTSVAAFNVLGTVNGPGHASASFFGTIGATFVGQSYQEVLMTLEAVGLQGVTFTGTFVVGTPAAMLAGGTIGRTALAAQDAPGAVLAAESVVPEPSTYALLATGLGVLGVAARRRRA
jgi:hypothetical protein